MMENAQDDEANRLKSVRTLLYYKQPDGKNWLDYHGDTIELLLTKKSWVESLRIVKLRVITDRIEELPQGVQAISTQTRSDELPVIFQAYLRKPGDPFDPEFHETRGTVHGIVALTKDKPSIILFIKYDQSVAGVRGVITVHAEIEVADNESLVSRTIVSKPVRLVFN